MSSEEFDESTIELHEGRPDDLTGREDKQIRAYDLLDSLGIKYKRTDHAPATTMEVCDVIDAVLDCLICKNLFLCTKKNKRFAAKGLYIVIRLFGKNNCMKWAKNERYMLCFILHLTQMNCLQSALEAQSSGTATGKVKRLWRGL